MQGGCPHTPACPGSQATDRDAARMSSHYPEQGWARLCNGVLVFEDTGELLPDGHTVGPRRPLPLPQYTGAGAVA
ncbi:DUF5999 family protein [Streptomyces sp. NPDC002476]|uniref:DUF5999 family protein n=1 Tax=Streptomyces sp. NPDC002476 TaxID=3364648 RepID=UPI0036B4DE74